MKDNFTKDLAILPSYDELRKVRREEIMKRTQKIRIEIAEKVRDSIDYSCEYVFDADNPYKEPIFAEIKKWAKSYKYSCKLCGNVIHIEPKELHLSERNWSTETGRIIIANILWSAFFVSVYGTFLMWPVVLGLAFLFPCLLHSMQYDATHMHSPFWCGFFEASHGAKIVETRVNQP